MSVRKQERDKKHKPSCATNAPTENFGYIGCTCNKLFKTLVKPKLKVHRHRYDRWCWHRPRSINVQPCARCMNTMRMACKCGKRDRNPA